MNKLPLAHAISIAIALAPLGALGQSYSKTEEIIYHDDTAAWIVGLQQKQTVNGTEVWAVTYNAKSEVATLSQFGKLVESTTYHSNGNVAAVTDANNQTTHYTDWYRGTPRKIQYPATPDSPSGSTQHASVNSNGWITSVTNEAGGTTTYDYDSMGRRTSTVFPAGDDVNWNAQNHSMRKLASGDWRPPGIVDGQWVHTSWWGNYRKITYFDGLLRPVLVHEYDESNSSGTMKSQSTTFSVGGQVVFNSYPSRDIIPAATGTWSFYDALGRIREVRQDSEQSQLVTLTQYVSGFRKRITNARGFVTEYEYQVFDEPTTENVTGITQLAGADTSATEIHRDVFGKVKRVRKRNADGALHVDRHYVYDQHQRLCKLIEPETGSTVMGYDDAGNVLWSSGGLTLPDTNQCNTADGNSSVRRVSRTYDNRNRLLTISYPDGRGNQSLAYTPDGLTASITTYSSPYDTYPFSNVYTYNKRRLQKTESLSQLDLGTASTIVSSYDENGSLLSETYPGGLVAGYSPNALGQPTTVGTFATAISYYPNGSVDGFTYGNGVVHKMTQNARQLPMRSSDCFGGSCVAGAQRLDLSYAYDKVGNVTSIVDNAAGNQGRSMSYDGLDRLTAASSPMFGSASYSYNALDNVTSSSVSGGSRPRSYLFAYDAENRLANVKDSATNATVIGIGYDAQGNVVNRNGVVHDFDYGNRLREVTGREVGYQYDGHGRRIRAATGFMNPRFRNFQYDRSGRLVYETTSGSITSHLYLNGSIIASHSLPIGIPRPQSSVTYYHTDALGTPVATSDAAGALTSTREYEPYGQAINGVAFNRVGYTGHVEDASTNLTYMQQRYYDPELGVFLSVDPVSADSEPLGYFHRYKYANNSPYRFKDPDGRCYTSTGKCMTQEEFDKAWAGEGSRVLNFIGSPLGQVADLVNGDMSGVIIGAVASRIPGGKKAGQVAMSGFFVRFGKSETTQELAEAAAKAEKAGVGHGVSVQARDKISHAARDKHRVADQDAVKEKFTVRQTGADKKHHTVDLPKPVTEDIKRLFDDLFK